MFTPIPLNPFVTSLFHVDKNGKIKVGLFLEKVNTLNFSLSVDILMEISPLSCQIKNSIGISKLSPSVKLLGLLQSGEQRNCSAPNLPKVIKTILFTVSTFSSLYPQTHTVFLCKSSYADLFPYPTPLPLLSFGLLLMGAVVRV